MRLASSPSVCESGAEGLAPRPLNKHERKRVWALRKRLAWLQARAAIREDVSFDDAEISALIWALGVIGACFPEARGIAYDGSKHYKSLGDRPSEPQTKPAGGVANKSGKSVL